MSKKVKSKFKVGDYVKGQLSNGGEYAVTNGDMLKAVVQSVSFSGGYETVIVQVLEHVYQKWVGDIFYVDAEYFDKINIFSVGDIICGTPESSKFYGYTSEYMSKAIVLEVLEGMSIKIKVLEHTKYPDEVGQTYTVTSRYFAPYIKKEKVKSQAGIIDASSIVGASITRATMLPMSFTIPSDNGFHVKVINELSVQFIFIGDKHILAVDTEGNIGKASKHPSDIYNEETGKAIAYFRLMGGK
jgi:hypothetical protein